MSHQTDNTVDAEKVINHKSYQEAAKEAGIIAGSAILGASLLGKVSKKLRWTGPAVLFIVTFRDDLDTIVRMVRAYIDGSYRKVPYTTVAKLVATLIYFVSPLDFIPDFIPIIGLMDDAALISWTMSSFQKDIDNFKNWEQGVINIG